MKAFTKHTLQYKVVSLERMYTQTAEMDSEVWIHIFVLTQHTHTHTHVANITREEEAINLRVEKRHRSSWKEGI